MSELSLQAPTEAESPVVFFTNGLGDNFLNLPALRALSYLFRDRLTLLRAEGSHEFLFDDLVLQKQIATSMRSTDEGRIFSASDLSSCIERCDLFISLVPWRSTSLIELVKSCRPDVSVGFFKDFDIHLPLDYGKHSAELAFDIVRLFDSSLSISQFSNPPPLPEHSVTRAEELLAALPPGSKVLAVHADTLREKMWPADRWVIILDRFLSEHQNFWVLVLGGTPQALDVGAHGERVIPCFGLPFSVSLALLAKADLFIGVDSCMLHGADFFRVPAVGLFGPTRAHEFGFLFGPNITLQAASRMDKIDAETVYCALESLLVNPHQHVYWTVDDGKSVCACDT